MIGHSSYDKARHYIETSTRESEEAKSLKKKLHPGPCISLSRETGVGAEIICAKIIEFFKMYNITGESNWGYFDKTLIEKVIEDHGLPPSYYKYLDVEIRSQMHEFFGGLFGVAPSMIKLLHKTTETIHHLAEFGNVIIVGRGSNVITANFKNAFHVRLVAPLHDRIQNCRELYGNTKKEAEEFIKHEDKERKEYLKNYFHKDIEDPLLYHIVVNTHFHTFNEVAQIIGRMVMTKIIAPSMFTE
jgi:cytidylate kinase